MDGRASTAARSRARLRGRWRALCRRRSRSRRWCRARERPRGVPHRATADRPRAARIVGTGADRVVAALAVRLPDRMDRWQVHDVEAHRRDVGQPLRRGVEATLATGEHLVPGALASARAVDPQRRRLGAREIHRVRRRGHEARDVLVEPRGQSFVQRQRRVAQPCCRGGDGRTQLLVDPARQPVEQPRPFLHDGFELRVADRCLDLGVVTPRGEAIGPCFDLELVVTDRVDDELARPSIETRLDQTQRRRAPLLGPRRPPAHPSRQHVVAVAVDRRADRHSLAHHRLGRHARGRAGANVFDRQSREHDLTVTTVVTPVPSECWCDCGAMAPQSTRRTWVLRQITTTERKTSPRSMRWKASSTWSMPMVSDTNRSRSSRPCR